MKIGAVLSGGGSTGAFQAGAIDYLASAGVQPAYVYGISAGALNGAMWQLDKVDELVAFWQNFRFEDAYKGPWWWNLLKGRMGLYTETPLQQLVDEVINPDDFTVGRGYHAGVVNYNTGEYEVFRPGDPHFTKAIVASTAVPLFNTPIEINGQLYMDGGVRNPTPIADVLGSTQIDFLYIINCTPAHYSMSWAGSTKRGVLRTIDLIMRTESIVYSEMYRNDMETFIRINNLLAAAGVDEAAGYRYIPYQIIEPDYWLGSGRDFNDRDRLIWHGYSKADRVCNNLGIDR